MATWIPAENVDKALAQNWPTNILDLANWAINDAPSIYHLLQTREIVECLIRAEALDAAALAKVKALQGSLDNYLAEPIEQKMEALKGLNRRISQLELDAPIDVSAYLRP